MPLPSFAAAPLQFRGLYQFNTGPSPNGTLSRQTMWQAVAEQGQDVAAQIEENKVDTQHYAHLFFKLRAQREGTALQDERGCWMIATGKHLKLFHDQLGHCLKEAVKTLETPPDAALLDRLASRYKLSLDDLNEAHEEAYYGELQIRVVNDYLSHRLEAGIDPIVQLKPLASATPGLEQPHSPLHSLAQLEQDMTDLGLDLDAAYQSAIKQCLSQTGLTIQQPIYNLTTDLPSKMDQLQVNQLA